MWLSSYQPAWHPGGCRFEPLPCSVREGSGIAMSCGVGCRRSSDPALPRLWCRPAARAPIAPLAWEPPCALGVALKRQKDQKKRDKTARNNYPPNDNHSFPSAELRCLIQLSDLERAELRHLGKVHLLSRCVCGQRDDTTYGQWIITHR